MLDYASKRNAHRLSWLDYRNIGDSSNSADMWGSDWAGSAYTRTSANSNLDITPTLKKSEF